MEICGGQTHGIVKFGLDQLLPPQVQLVHGPGCPVCVTPVASIDRALAIAARPEVIFCSFGDMLRVPGSHGSLLDAKARGADVRVVYAPLDAVQLAAREPQRQVVFFAIGFETTAPANALAVRTAHRTGLTNFSLLTAQVRVPPAMATLLADPECVINGFLAAGHVCTITGLSEYPALASQFQVPIVVTGFEPVDILHGIHHCLRQLEQGQAEVENAYSRCARANGNPAAQALIAEVFTTVDREWRGLGLIPRSGWGLAHAYADYDAERRFELNTPMAAAATDCISGEILRGTRKPSECPAFGGRCTPEHPLGATMVSSEGACAAYYLYRRST